MDIWKIIISKKSGNGKAFAQWPEVKDALVEKGLQFSESFTEYVGHATELAREAIRGGFRKILAVGGDGTIHEILNGVMTQDEVPSSEITLAIVPVGSGNDWARLYDLPKESAAAVDLLTGGRTLLQDVVKVESVLDGEPSVRYMMNIGGLGIDAHVCYLFELEKQKGKKDKNSMGYKVNSAAKSVAKTTAGTVGREVGKTLGKTVGGSFGKTLGGNVGASLGRGIMGLFFKS